jgi:hypothetical protein
LGAIAGLGQTQLGWGGPFATRNAIATIVCALSASAGFYVYQMYEQLEDEKDPPMSAASRPALRRRQTVRRITPLEDEVYGTKSISTSNMQMKYGTKSISTSNMQIATCDLVDNFLK